jgi:hypothetical protein
MPRLLSDADVKERAEFRSAERRPDSVVSRIRPHLFIECGIEPNLSPARDEP